VGVGGFDIASAAESAVSAARSDEAEYGETSREVVGGFERQVNCWRVSEQAEEEEESGGALGEEGGCEDDEEGDGGQEQGNGRGYADPESFPLSSEACLTASLGPL
jgi:hypothetical protein